MKKYLEYLKEATINNSNIDNIIWYQMIWNNDIEDVKNNMNKVSKELRSYGLLRSVDNNFKEIVKLLLTTDVDVNFQDKDKRTPLIISTRSVIDIDILIMLLNHPDINVNLQDEYGFTALINASDYTEPQTDKIILLLKHPDIDVNITTYRKKEHLLIC